MNETTKRTRATKATGTRLCCLTNCRHDGELCYHATFRGPRGEKVARYLPARGIRAFRLDLPTGSPDTLEAFEAHYGRTRPAPWRLLSRDEGHS